MNVIDLLRYEHSRLNELFKQAIREKGIQRKNLLFENIKNDLETHSFAEEAVFYPAFKDREEFRELLNSSYHEHKSIEKLINETSDLPINGKPFSTHLEDLAKTVTRHIQIEERFFFPLAEKTLTSLELESLGYQFQNAKQERFEAA